MKLLFVKGEKGLVAKSKGKMYFPNRDSEIIVPGVYECEVAKDKDKYAFVNGTRVICAVPSIEYFDRVYKAVGDNARNSIYTGGAWFKYVGTNIITIVNYGNYWQIGYTDGEQQMVVIESTFGALSREKLYNVTDLEDAVNTAKIKKELFKLRSLALPDESRMRMIVLALGYAGVRHANDIKDITIADNKYIVVKKESTYEEGESYFRFDGTTLNVVPRSYMTDIADISEYREQIYVGDVIKYAYDNKMAITDGYFTKDKIIEKVVRCFCSVLTIKMFSAAYSSDEFSDEEKEAVEQSFKELEEFRSAASKNVTSKTVDELAQLMPRKIVFR